MDVGLNGVSMDDLADDRQPHKQPSVSRPATRPHGKAPASKKEVGFRKEQQWGDTSGTDAFVMERLPSRGQQAQTRDIGNKMIFA